jgi:hypothetical protein
MKYWEIIVNKIIKAGFSVGWVSAVDNGGRTVWIVVSPMFACAVIAPVSTTAIANNFFILGVVSRSFGQSLWIQ